METLDRQRWWTKDCVSGDSCCSDPTTAPMAQLWTERQRCTSRHMFRIMFTRVNVIAKRFHEIPLENPFERGEERRKSLTNDWHGHDHSLLWLMWIDHFDGTAICGSILMRWLPCFSAKFNQHVVTWMIRKFLRLALAQQEADMSPRSLIELFIAIQLKAWSRIRHGC